MFKREAGINLLIVLVPIIAMVFVAIWLIWSKQKELDEALQTRNKVLNESKSNSSEQGK